MEDADKIKAYVIELWTWINIPCSLKILILSIFLILMLLAIYSVLIAGEKNVILPELFVQRYRELERVKDFINKYSIVTVDSEWGNGKTLLMNHFREDEKDNYIYIRFKPLSFDIRNITLYIISELQTVLLQNRVAQGYFNVLQKLAAKNKWAGIFFSLFYSNDQQTSELLKQIITDCKNLGKPVIIFFEDIDRINNAELLSKIFSISETLVDSDDSPIKIVFECNTNIIRKILQTSYENNKVLQTDANMDDYFQKYFTHVVSIKKLNLIELVINFLEIDKEKDEKIQEFSDIDINIIQALRQITMPMVYTLDVKFLFDYDVTPRGVYNALVEINNYLNDDYWKERKLEKVIVMLVLLQHFDVNSYKNVIEEMKQHKILDLGKNKLSSEKYYWYDFFERIGYNGQDNQQIDLYGDKNDLYLNLNTLRMIYRDVVIKTGIEHLIDAGNPKFTDCEASVRIFADRVLYVQGDAGYKFRNFRSNYSDELFTLFPNNRTIFHFELPDENTQNSIMYTYQAYVVIIARAMYLCNAPSHLKERLLKFYFETDLFGSKNVINNVAIVVMRSCLYDYESIKEELFTEISNNELSKKSLLVFQEHNTTVMLIMRYFGEKELEIGLSNNRGYWELLVECIKFIVHELYCISSFDFDDAELEKLRFSNIYVKDSQVFDSKIKVLDECIDSMNNVFNNKEFLKAQELVGVLIKFLDINLQYLKKIIGKNES